MIASAITLALAWLLSIYCVWMQGLRNGYKMGVGDNMKRVRVNLESPAGSGYSVLDMSLEQMLRRGPVELSIQDSTAVSVRVIA